MGVPSAEPAARPSAGVLYSIRRRPSVGSSGSVKPPRPGVPSRPDGAPGIAWLVRGDPPGMGMGGRCAPSCPPGRPGPPGPPGEPGPLGAPGMGCVWGAPAGRPPGTVRPAPPGTGPGPPAGASAGPAGALGAPDPGRDCGGCGGCAGRPCWASRGGAGVPTATVSGAGGASNARSRSSASLPSPESAASARLIALLTDWLTSSSSDMRAASAATRPCTPSRMSVSRRTVSACLVLSRLSLRSAPS